MDFVSGWLGTLKNFYDNTWTIDVETGKSQGQQHHLKLILSKHSLISKLNEKCLSLDPHATLTWAGAGHGVNLEDLEEFIAQQSIKIVYLDTESSQNQAQISWEFHVKTYMKSNRGQSLQQHNWKQWGIDSMINKSNPTNQDRVQWMDHSLRTYSPVFHSHPTQPGLKINYDDIFRPGGSKLLCQQLDISASDRHHDFWDSMLTYATSPKEFQVWGHTWKYLDYF